MTLFPPLPAWSSMHPLIVHFPIGLLLVAPLALAGGLVFPRVRRGMFVAAFLLTALGTFSLVLATAAGEAAAEAAKVTHAVEAAIEEHEELAEAARALFIGLTVLLGLVLWGPSILKRSLPRGVETVVMLALLTLYAGSALVLANTADKGGRLVHTHGVHATLPADAGAPAMKAGGEGAPPSGGDGDGDAD